MTPFLLPRSLTHDGTLVMIVCPIFLKSLVNSLALRRCSCNSKCLILKHIFGINFLCISSEIAIRWMLQIFLDGEFTLVQLMAWCHQSPSHYLNHCWPSCITSYGITRVQWVNHLGVGMYILMYSGFAIVFYSDFFKIFLLGHLGIPWMTWCYMHCTRLYAAAASRGLLFTQ